MHFQSLLGVCFLAAGVASRSLSTTAEAITERSLIGRDPNECGDDDNGITKRAKCAQPVQCGRKLIPFEISRLSCSKRLSSSTAEEDRQAYTPQFVNSAVKAAKPLISKNEKSKPVP